MSVYQLSAISERERVACARSLPAVVCASELVRRYGDADAAVNALRTVSLEIEEGRLTALLGGPSGSATASAMAPQTRPKHRPR